MGRASAARKVVLTARNADKFSLYQQSVQDPAAEIEFLDHVFEDKHGRKAMHVREDFCGTAAFCAAWAASHPSRTAVGVDLDGPTLAYGTRHNLEPLGPARDRVRLLNQDVRAPVDFKVELTVAMNFSYCVFKTRSDILGYCRAARDGLRPGGAFIMDLYGGTDAQTELDEKTTHKGFTYVWEQEPLDAISGECKRHITFRFPDGSALERAFSYDWRLWHLPELADVMRDAGFATVDIWWEGADEKGRGNGEYKKQEHAENEQAYIAYLVGWR